LVRSATSLSAAGRSAPRSSGVYAELGVAFTAAAHATDVRCVVVGADGPIFSAGNDVAELAGLTADPPQ
jgi:enoyl-CoA hydratase/carnithine racemase